MLLDGQPSSCRRIAVAIHDVEPATFERCALMRDWLDDHGVDRATLLVIPAPDLHPFSDRRPELAEWLNERARAGDAVAQHGLQHRRTRSSTWRRRPPTAEFVGLGSEEARRAVIAGRRVLKLAGVEPRGFVAPAYAYTPALRSAVADCFDWWAGAGALYLRQAARAAVAPALGLTSAGLVQRIASPWVVRAGTALAGPLLRLDLHPGDLDHPRHIGAFEHALRRARRRGCTAVTYDDLAGPPA